MLPTAECDGNASYERNPPQATLLNTSRRQTAPDRNGLDLVATRVQEARRRRRFRTPNIGV
eukprot:4020934-Pyramimonas_sp.AAC.1